MPKISVKLPERMYQQLLLTTQEFDLENGLVKNICGRYRGSEDRQAYDITLF